MPFLHGRNTVVMVDTYDLSQYFSEASSAQKSDMSETTAFGASAKSYVTSFADGSVTLKGFYDAAAGAVDEYLSAAVGQVNDGVMTYGPGGPTVGASARLLPSLVMEYEVTAPVQDVVSITASAMADGKIEPGRWLAIRTVAAVASAINGAAVDNTVSSATGAVAHLHVPVNTRNGTTVVKVQHSVDNTTWVDLITFTTVAATTVATQRSAVAGTVNRYLRSVITPAGSTGSLTVSVAIARR